MIRLTSIAIILSCHVFASVIIAEIPIPFNYQMSSPAPEVQNEEQIVVCPTDTNLVMAIWRDFRLGYRQVGIGRSTDGGTTWTDSLLAPSFQLMTHQSDPALTVDDNGNIYICIMDYRHTDSGPMRDSSYLSIIKSTDGGLTWTGPVTVVDTIGPYLDDKEFITADRTGGPYDGNLYVAWARYYNSGPSQIMFSRSINGGASFEDTMVIGPPVEYYDHYQDTTVLEDAGQFAQPLVGSDGSVYVFWVGWIQENYDYYDILTMVKSTDGGISWTEPVLIHRVDGHWDHIDGGIDVYSAPSSAADISGGPFNGNLYIAFTTENADNSLVGHDIAFIRSTDDGQTWSEPIIINDDGDNPGPNPPYDQFHPWLYCNEEGVLVVIFYDQRTDSLNHYLFDVYAAYSFDGGETFTTNHRISSISINPDYLENTEELTTRNDRIAPRAGLIAEYIGVTANHDHVHAVWTDTRNGNQDVFGADWTIPTLPPRVFTRHEYAGRLLVSVRDTIFSSTSWQPGEDSYRFEFDDTEDFIDIDYGVTVSERLLRVAEIPLPDGIYYCRVQAYQNSGDSSGYSLVRLIDFDNGLPAMAIDLSPGPSDTLYDWYSTYQLMSWSVETPISREAPEWFELEISTDSLFSGIPYYHYTDSLTKTWLYVSYLPINTKLFWKINHYDLLGNESGYCPSVAFHYLQYICGDVNDDRSVNVGDVVYVINFIFKNGPQPRFYFVADVNDDDDVNVGDAVYLINYIFKNGPVPNCAIW